MLLSQNVLSQTSIVLQGGMVCVCGGTDLVTFAMSAFITTIAAKIKIKQTRSND